MNYKPPTSYPIPDKFNKDPYKTLGIKDTDSLSTIHSAYKKLSLVLHPDKSLSKEAMELGWSLEDKNEAYVAVKEAYDTILKLIKESDCPDYNIDYYINEELKIKQDNEFYKPKQQQQRPQHRPQQQRQQRPQQQPQQQSQQPQQQQQQRPPLPPLQKPILIKSHHEDQDSLPIGETPHVDSMDTLGSTFNTDKFNKKFESNKNLHKKNGIVDPYSKGYAFGRTSNEEARAIMKSGTRANVEIPKEYKFDEPELNEDGTLMVYVPKDTSKFGLPTHNVQYGDLGLTTVSDYSVKSTYKGGLYGTDLNSAYGSNTEYWADVALKKDKDLYKKYHEEEKLDKLMAAMQTSRVDKYDFDPIIQQQLDREEEQERKLEELRLKHQERQDIYYEQMAAGRVSYEAGDLNPRTKIENRVNVVGVVGVPQEPYTRKRGTNEEISQSFSEALAERRLYG